MAKTGAETQRERIAAGKCCSCIQPATHGVRCEYHWLREKERAAKRYQDKKAKGVCGMCGKNPPTPDYETCQSCRTKQNEERRVPEEEKRAPFDKPYHQRNKKAGYCMTGGKDHPRPEGDNVQCNLCLEKKRLHSKKSETRQKTNAREREKAKEKAAKGICTRAGCNNLAEPNRKVCIVHRKENKTKHNKQYRKLKDLVYSKYGGYECSCPGCLCDDPAQMELDHINGDGAAHRREVFGDKAYDCKTMYCWLRDNNFPPIVQPMCKRCNLSKGTGQACEHAGTPHNLPSDLLLSILNATTIEQVKDIQTKLGITPEN